MATDAAAPSESASRGRLGRLRGWADEKRISAGRIGGWAAREPLAAVTLVGLAVYALVRFSLTRFYSRFGIDPEDVGLGYTETLSRAFIGVAWVVVGIVAATAAVYLYVRASRWTGLSDGERRTFIQQGLVVGVIAAIIACVYVPLSAEILAVRAQHGQSISPNDQNPLAIRAEHVDVTWEGTRPQVIRHCGCVLLYLGRANGLAAFYDSTHHRTLRIPEAGLRFSVQRNEPGWFSDLLDWTLRL